MNGSGPSGSGDKFRKPPTARGSRGGHSLGRREGCTNLLQNTPQPSVRGAHHAVSMMALPDSLSSRRSPRERSTSAPPPARAGEAQPLVEIHQQVLTFDEAGAETVEAQFVIPPTSNTTVSSSTDVVMDLPQMGPSRRTRRGGRPQTADPAAFLPPPSDKKRKK